MLELDTRQIRMGQRARGQSPAPARRGAGRRRPGRARLCRGREEARGTRLPTSARGIAIPHGTPDTRELVFSTGVRLLQFPEGVDWGDGQQVYLAIGIAAKSDEHLQLLQLLTRALGGADLGPALSAAASAEEVLGLLQGRAAGWRWTHNWSASARTPRPRRTGLARRAPVEEAGCVENGFAAVLQQTEPLPLGDGLCWCTANNW